MSNPTLRVLSLGAGLDSTTLLLMSQHGVLPRLDAAIFADTMAEPQGVYDTLEWLTAATRIPILRVSAGNLEQDMRAHLAGTGGASHYYPPFFVRKADGTAGAPLHRRCTKQYKIVPIRQAIRQLLGKKAHGPLPGIHVEQWLGFTLDDLHRTVCSDVQWITNSFPLILPLGMHKRDCMTWLTAHGYSIPPKSSCVFCPFHHNAYWRDMRDNRPDEWHQAVAFEAAMHVGSLPGAKGTPYLHKSLVPLPMAPIDTTDTGQDDLFCFTCNT